MLLSIFSAPGARTTIADHKFWLDAYAELSHSRRALNRLPVMDAVRVELDSDRFAQWTVMPYMPLERFGA